MMEELFDGVQLCDGKGPIVFSLLLLGFSLAQRHVLVYDWLFGLAIYFVACRMVCINSV